MAKEMTTPGHGQIRAFFVSSGNPVLSVPDGDELEQALGGLELMVAIDLYVTETSRHADYVLPATTFLEREDFPSAFLTFHTTPFVQWTEPVLEPRGEARQEWQIIDELARRIGTTPASAWPLRALGRLGLRLSPRRLIDLGLRLGPRGDLFGLRRGGLSIARLRGDPTASCSADHHPSACWPRRSSTATSACTSMPPRSSPRCARSGARTATSRDYPLRLIGLRELRSHNSWMHNAPKLMRGGRAHAARDPSRTTPATHGRRGRGDVPDRLRHAARSSCPSG